MRAILNRLFILLGILLVIVATGTFGFVALEGLSAFESLYLTVSTITTVGYGDIVPYTTGGRLLAMAIVVIGFTFFTGVVVTSVQLVFERREENHRTQQLSTLTTLFFNEVGNSLIKLLGKCDTAIDQIEEIVPAGEVWTEEDFSRLSNTLKHHPCDVNIRCLDIEGLQKLFASPLLLKLLESPHIFDHALFNGLLRAIFHFQDELEAHQSFSHLSEVKTSHISTDLKKVYQPLTKLWVEHMCYLKKLYPILFLTVLETNPFKKESGAAATPATEIL
ncbi:hypothetical protein DGWBC_1553 [Dehalogenimonas sp. WBC-2]|nr:hypothetical protein DGWBC_1553 [Dehalogenimonas sp. WBC-2]